MPTALEIESILKPLRNLNSSWDVANFLGLHGAVGRRFRATQCPLALYIEASFTEPPQDVAVLCDVVSVDGVHYPISRAMSDFVQDFDENRFPGLVMPDAR